VQLFREVLEAREVVGRKDSWDISAISEGGEDSRTELNKYCEKNCKFSILSMK